MKSAPWFRKRKGLFSRDMGYGYVPISWEGWVSLAVFILGILFLVYITGLYKDDTTTSATNYLLLVLSWTVIFLFFC